MSKDLKDLIIYVCFTVMISLSTVIGYHSFVPASGVHVAGYLKIHEPEDPADPDKPLTFNWEFGYDPK